MPLVLKSGLNYKIVDVDVGSASTEIIKANPYRRYLLIQNKSDEAVYINIGESVSGTNGIQLAAVDASGNVQGQIEFSNAQENVTRDAIYAVCSSGNKGVVTVEGFTGNQSAPDNTVEGESSSSSDSSSSSESSESSESSASESSSSSSV